jgi:PAS domain S-box-containing protein
MQHGHAQRADERSDLMSDRTIHRKPVRFAALIAAVLYLIVAALWITWSDQLLLSVEPDMDAKGITRLHTYMGWLFVAVTALGLYLLLNRSLTRILRSEVVSQAATQRYRELFDSSIDGVLVARPDDGTILGANAAACRMFGYSEQEMLCLRRADLMDVADQRWANALQLRQLSRSARAELMFIRKDGTRFQGEVSSTLFRDEHGREYSSAILRDVTERNLAEQARRATEERYRALFFNNPLPMWIYDVESFKFLAVNDVACESYGYSRDEFHAMTILSICAEEDQTLVRHAVEQDKTIALTGRIWRHRKKDGSIIRAELTSHDLEWEGGRARFACPIDITERLRADEAVKEANRSLEQKAAERTSALAESEARQRILTDAIPQIVWFIDAKGRAQYLNHAWFAFSGRTLEQSLGYGWLEALHPDDIDSVRDAWQAAGSHGAQFEGRCRIRAANGQYGSFIYAARPVRNDEGAITHWVGVHTDVTELERAQNALRQSNAELEAFSYTVSHDLQAPLRTINGYSQILIEDYADQLDEGATKTLGRITRAAAKMSVMIDELLALARVSRIKIQPTEIDVTTIARDIVTELQASEVTRQVEWRMQEGVAATGDLRLVRTALENLLSNAWKFTSKRDNAVIEVGCTRNAEGEIVLHVKDNGAGFDMAYAGKLFGVFQRLHSEAEFEGVGIGLATVRRIVQRHGGRIWAESKVGEGTILYFTLPSLT